MKTWSRIGGSLVLVVLLACTIDLRRVAESFARLDARWWLAAVGVYAATQVVSGMRWRQLALALGFGGSVLRYIAYYFIGMFFNLVLPTSVGGDVVRAWYLARQHEGPPEGRKGAAVLSVAADRLSGLLVLIALGCAAAALSPVPLEAWVLAAVACVGVAAVGCVLSLSLLGRVARNHGLVRRLLDGAAALVRDRRLLVGTTALSVLIQLANVVVVWLIGVGLGLTVPFAYYAVFVPLITLLTLVPVSVNGMGLREWGTIALLSPLGVEAAPALTLGFLTFAAMAVPSLAGGGCYWLGSFPRFDAAASPARGGPSEVSGHGDALGDRPDQGRTRQPSAAA